MPFLISPFAVVRIVSIDIGRRNFAMYVEDVPFQKLLTLRETSTNSSEITRRRDLFPHINKLYKLGTRVLLEKVDICSKESTEYDNDSRMRLFSYLSSRREHLDSADVVVVERQYFAQLAFGKKTSKRAGSEANIVAIKIAESVQSWFLIAYEGKKEVIPYPSNFKTMMLGAPKGLKKPERKKWCVKKSLEIMKLRKDEEGISVFTRRGKKDDLGDVVIQCQAFLFKELLVAKDDY